MQMSTQRKIAAIVITTVALTSSTVGVSAAATKSTRVSVTNPGAIGVKSPRGLDLAATLSALVTKGTITQTQADAIIAAADAAKVAAEAARTAARAAAELAKPLRAEKAAELVLISTTIGVDTATIKSRLAAGETLAAIAGVKKDALITALVADETKRIDAAVTAGKLTAAQATFLKERLVAHVTEEVNEVRSAGPKGGFKGGFGHKGKGDFAKAPRMPAPRATASASA
jgi:hypothetical protein